VAVRRLGEPRHRHRADALRLPAGQLVREVLVGDRLSQRRIAVALTEVVSGAVAVEPGADGVRIESLWAL
jgi:hypothetical protein